MGYNPNIHHLEVGYNPFTNHLLTSRGIQVQIQNWAEKNTKRLKQNRGYMTLWHQLKQSTGRNRWKFSHTFCCWFFIPSKISKLMTSVKNQQISCWKSFMAVLQIKSLWSIRQHANMVGFKRPGEAKWINSATLGIPNNLELMINMVVE